MVCYRHSFAFSIINTVKAKLFLCSNDKTYGVREIQVEEFITTASDLLHAFVALNRSQNGPQSLSVRCRGEIKFSPSQKPELEFSADQT
jgi:hypothetical protein